MLLEINNIGKIKSAKVKLDGITVVTGINDTGKSTIGKVLYSFFNGFNRVKKRIEEERTKRISGIVERTLEEKFFSDESFYIYEETDGILEAIMNLYKGRDIDDILPKDIADIFEEREEEIKERYSIEEVLHVDESLWNEYLDTFKITDDELLKAMLTNAFQGEFSDQINNMYSDEEGVISLTIRNREVKVSLLSNQVTSMNSFHDVSRRAVYIDDTMVIDGPWPIGYRGIKSNHKDHLRKWLLYGHSKESYIDEIIIGGKLEEVYQMLNEVCQGEIHASSRGEFVYRLPRSNKSLRIRNLSVGLKTFVILKTLLKKGIIEEGGVLILDEPEIHLHPKWQLLLAELIVMLQKKFELHILLNTHSPYFLDAIDVYSKKHGISERCNFYLMEEQEDGMSILEDITDDLEPTFYKMADPMRELERERSRYEED